MFDVFCRDVSTGECCCNTSVYEHDDAMAKPYQLIGVGAGNQGGDTIVGRGVDERMYLIFGSDIDALCRFVE